MKKVRIVFFMNYFQFCYEKLEWRNGTQEIVVQTLSKLEAANLLTHWSPKFPPTEIPLNETKFRIKYIFQIIK